MNFKNYFIWLKYTIYTPSFFWRNRLFIEKFNKNDHVYSFFGETQKSFTWTKKSGNNSAPFWFQTAQFRIIIWTFVFTVLFYNLSPQDGLLEIYHNMYYIRLIKYKFWRFFDLFILNILQLHFMISSIIFTSFFYTTKLITKSTLTLDKWLTWFHAEPHPKKTDDLNKDFAKLVNIIRTSNTEFRLSAINKHDATRYLKFIRAYYRTLKFLKENSLNISNIGNFNILDNELNLLKYKCKVNNVKHDINSQYTLKSVLNKLYNTNYLFIKQNRNNLNDLNLTWTNPHYFNYTYLNFIKEQRFIFKNLNINNFDLISFQHLNNESGVLQKYKKLLNSTEWKIFRDNTLYANITLKETLTTVNLKYPKALTLKKNTLQNKIHTPLNLNLLNLIEKKTPIVKNNYYYKTKQQFVSNFYFINFINFFFTNDSYYLSNKYRLVKFSTKQKKIKRLF